MQICLGVTARDYEEAVGLFPRNALPRNLRFVYAAYRIGPDSTLLRQNLPLQTRGGLLCVGDGEPAPAVEDPAALCGAVLRECVRRGYTGVVLDFETPPTEDRRALCTLLQKRLRETGRTLYLPPSWIDAAPDAVLLLCTAVSGGDFSTYLRETVEERQGRPVALDAERLRMDFRLPAPDGNGVPLDADTLRTLSEGKAVFFSPELCTRYFTFVDNGEAHFVLFDDADTMCRKLRLGESLGIETAFLMWPEIRDIAGDLGRLWE